MHLVLGRSMHFADRRIIDRPLPHFNGPMIIYYKSAAFAHKSSKPDLVYSTNAVTYITYHFLYGVVRIFPALHLGDIVIYRDASQTDTLSLPGKAWDMPW